MTRLERQSWYGLFVTALMLLAVGLIYSFTGSSLRSTAGFALMALLGFTELVASAGPEPKIKMVAPAQKHLFWWSVAFVVLLTTFVEWGVRSGLPTLFGALAIVAIYWQKRRLLTAGSLRMPLYDEREQAVIHKSSRVAFGLFWVLFVMINTLVPLFHRDPIPSHFLVWEILMGCWVMVVARSAATLWQERLHG